MLRGFAFLVATGQLLGGSGLLNFRSHRRLKLVDFLLGLVELGKDLRGILGSQLKILYGSAISGKRFVAVTRLQSRSRLFHLKHGF